MRLTGLDLPDKTFAPGDLALIIGAGLAGCATAYALAKQGIRCKVFDCGKQPASATSAVPVAIYRPYLSVEQNTSSDYFTSAFEHLLTELRVNPGVDHQPRGVLQLIDHADRWTNAEHWSVETSSAASAIANTPIKSPALLLPTAGTLTPACLCSRWLQSSADIEFIPDSTVSTIEQNTTTGWTVNTANNHHVDGDLLVLANGNGVNSMFNHIELPLIPLRGQLSHFNTSGTPADIDPVIAAKGYVIPTNTGYWAGATHQRNQTSCSVNMADDEHNRATLESIIPDTCAATLADRSWVGIRCTTPDRLPIVGSVPDVSSYKTVFKNLHHGKKHQRDKVGEAVRGLYVLSGLGSRGATQALYAAECLTDIIMGTVHTDPTHLTIIHPARFLMKQLRQRPPP